MDFIDQYRFFFGERSAISASMLQELYKLLNRQQGHLKNEQAVRRDITAKLS